MRRECKGSVPGLAFLPWLQAWKKARSFSLERREGEGVVYSWDTTVHNQVVVWSIIVVVWSIMAS